VSFGLRQSLVIAAAGVAVFVVAASAAHRQRMSLRYTILWVVIAGAGVLGALLTFLVAPLSEALGMSPTGFLLAVASALLLTVTMMLSVSVSGLQSEIREIAESHALLANELAELKVERSAE